MLVKVFDQTAEVRPLGPVLLNHGGVKAAIAKDLEVSQYRFKTTFSRKFTQHNTYYTKCQHCDKCPKEWRFDYVTKAGGLYNVGDLIKRTNSEKHNHPENTRQRYRTVVPAAQMTDAVAFAKLDGSTGKKLREHLIEVKGCSLDLSLFVEIGFVK